MSKEHMNTYYNSKNPSSPLNCLDIAFSVSWIQVGCSIERDQCMKGLSAPC